MAQTAVIDLLGPVAELCRGCPNPTLTRAYIDATRIFCQKSRFLQVTSTSQSTAIATVDYTITPVSDNDIIGLFRVVMVEASGKVRDLVEKAADDWDLNDIAGVPEFYEYVPHGQFRLHKTPDAVYPLRLTSILQPTRASTTIDSRLVTTWEETLRDGALSKVLLIPKMPWTDPVAARMRAAEFSIGCNTANIQVSRGNNPGARSSDLPGPPSGMIRSQILPL